MRIRAYIIFIIGLVILTLVYSYRNPGKMTMVDKVRVPAQGAIMAYLGDYNLKQLDILNESTDAGSHYFDIDELAPFLESLQPGDIFFTNNEKYLSSQFIPGEWKHAVIYLGSPDTLAAWFGKNNNILKEVNLSGLNNHNHLIYDSSVDGVSIRHISSLSNLQDQSMMTGMVAFRIQREKDTIKEFISHAFSHMGKPYDYDLHTGNTLALYCSELLYESLKHIGVILPVNERLFGREVITPNGMVHYIMQHGIDNGDFGLLFMLNDHSMAGHR